MTRPEERLAELLHDTTPEPVRDLSYEAVVDRVRARRRSARALAVGGTAVLAVLAVVSVAALSGSRAPASGPGPAVTATPSPLPPEGTIDFQGVRVTVPGGWTVGEIPECGFAPDRTVEVQRGVRGLARCPMMLAPRVLPRTLTLTTLNSWAGAAGYGWGTATTWHGQPAFFVSGTDARATYTTLVLPWLNVMVDARGRSHAEVTALLASIVPRPSADLGVPADADAVEVVWQPAKADDGFVYRAHVTRQVDVAALLADLQAAAPVSASRVCRSLEATDGAVLTVRAGGTFRTFVASFGACGQVTNGRGVAGKVGDGLRADVVRLAPPSKPYENPAGCTIAGGGDAQGTDGEPTAEAALRKFLAGRPAGFPRDAVAYTQVAEGIFLSDRTEVVVTRLLPPGTGYAVDLTSDCGWYY
jgi:hypothetical protein